MEEVFSLMRRYAAADGRFLVIPSVPWRHDAEWPWKPNRYYYYPFVLMSYGLIMRDGEPSVRPVPVPYFPDSVLFVDSGGFQLATGVASSIEQRSVLRWQVANADVAFMLDLPAFGKEGATPNTWRKSLEFTRRSTNEIMRLWDRLHEEYGRDRKLVLYAVIHGLAPWQLETYFKEVVEPLIETGIATGLATGGTAVLRKPYPVVYWLRFTEQMGLRYVHLLGVGSPNAFGVILYYLKNSRGHELVTADTSTPSLLLAKGRVYAPLGGASDLRLRDGTNRPTFCSCPSCMYYRRTHGHWPWELRHLHKNHYPFLYAHNLFWLLAQLSAQEWKIYAAGELPERHDMVDYALDHDYHEFFVRYCNEFPSDLLALAGGCPRGGKRWW